MEDDTKFGMVRIFSDTARVVAPTDDHPTCILDLVVEVWASDVLEVDQPCPQRSGQLFFTRIRFAGKEATAEAMREAAIGRRNLEDRVDPRITFSDSSPPWEQIREARTEAQAIRFGIALLDSNAAVIAGLADEARRITDQPRKSSES